MYIGFWPCSLNYDYVLRADLIGCPYNVPAEGASHISVGKECLVSADCGEFFGCYRAFYETPGLCCPTITGSHSSLSQPK